MKKENFFATVSLIVVASIMGTVFFMLKDNPDKGTIGDMFGVANTLFSGLAFSGLIYAIIIQTHELRLQRDSIDSVSDLQRRSVAEMCAQTNFSEKALKLKALSAALEATVKQMAIKSSIENSQTKIKLQERKESIEKDIEKIIYSITTSTP